MPRAPHLASSHPLSTHFAFVTQLRTCVCGGVNSRENLNASFLSLFSLCQPHSHIASLPDWPVMSLVWKEQVLPLTHTRMSHSTSRTPARTSANISDHPLRHPRQLRHLRHAETPSLWMAASLSAHATSFPQLP